MRSMRKMRVVLRLLPAIMVIACALPAAGQPQAPRHQVFKQGSDLHEALQQDGPASSNALNYIVGVVDALNGTLTLTSAAGAGTTLRVTLPLPGPA